MAAQSQRVPLITHSLLAFLLLSLHPYQSRCTKFGPRVIVPDPSFRRTSASSPVSAPAPTSGGDLPRLPLEGSHASGPAAYSFDPIQPVSGSAPSDAPSSESNGGIPFINSNPAVPLPTGITDTATILPLPSPGDDTQVVGMGSFMQIRVGLVVLAMMFSFWTIIITK